VNLRTGQAVLILSLLEKLKVITAGVDTKANTALTLHKQILSFFIIRKGVMESDDDCLIRFSVKAKNLELAGEEHIFCSPIIIKKAIHEVTDDEVETKCKRFHAMCFVLHADEIHHGELQEELKCGVFKGKDEYPSTVSNAYELFLHTSHQIGVSHRRATRMNNRFRRSNPQKIHLCLE